MRPNLSVEKIAGALAVLGASVLITACGGDEKKPNTPVTGSDVSPTSSAGGGDGHCGAAATHKSGETSCGAKPAGGDTTPKTETATPPATTTPATTAAAPTTSAKPAASGTAAPKGTPASGGKKGGSGSCGAGTCSAKK